MSDFRVLPSGDILNFDNVVELIETHVGGITVYTNNRQIVVPDITMNDFMSLPKWGEGPDSKYV